MASLTTSTDTDFTPAAGDFNVQVIGSVQLVRKNSAGAPFALVQSIINGAVVVSNPVAGAVYRLTSMQGSAAAALAAGVLVAVDQ
jgi:hypothetical protein